MAEERQDIGIGGEAEGLLDRFCKGRGAVQLLLFNSLLLEGSFSFLWF